MPTRQPAKDGQSLAAFACPNDDCDRFNHFNAGNLSVVERMGKNKAIGRLRCNVCGHRFSERQGSLMQYTKLPEAAVVRIVKCLGHGCCIEATADICDVDPRTVSRLLERAGRRAEDFHRLQLERLDEPLQAVELDELHARVCNAPGKKGGDRRPVATRSAAGAMGLLGDVASWVETGFTRLWPSSRDS
jgi:transposase-like protein